MCIRENFQRKAIVEKRGEEKRKFNFLEQADEVNMRERTYVRDQR